MSGQAAEPSLVQQRLALQRERTIAMVLLVFQVVGTAFIAFAVIVDSRDWYWWALVAACGVVVAVGARRFRRANAAINDFAKRHGRDAGRQR
ncbi:hypothetical protein KZC52_16800 [Microbacterium sp. kSW2-24]|uniref:hypothetical protein n=1 Tax=Microbacterium galbinum TaxID=2851646 RepID=UPI001FFDA122|nr:hypothetical protein [Microbacterium galbinum]MCK2024589.1 hypothetical protein [Microbacterium galbinum]